MNEEAIRAALIAEAYSWAGTRYHYRPANTAAKVSRLKGAGADCLTFMIGVYYNVGLIKDFEIPWYRPDFMKHSYEADILGQEKRETYLEGVLGFGHEVEEPKPADVVLYRFTETQIFAHGGIIVDWELSKMIHCYTRGVIETLIFHRGHAGIEHKFISAFPLKGDLPLVLP
jgi:hypothetical protein